MEEAVRLAHENKERHWEACSRVWLGKISGKMGRSKSERAKQDIVEGTRILDELRIKPFSAQGYLFLGELYADTDQREKALEHLGKAQSMFQEMGMDYWLAKTQEVLGRL
jgi:hypothetical protein